MARLRTRLEQGPAAARYGEDQRWTLVRVVALIATLFHLRVSVTTAWQAMRRLGYTAQLPIHRVELDDVETLVPQRRSQRLVVVTSGLDPYPNTSGSNPLSGAVHRRNERFHSGHCQPELDRVTNYLPVMVSNQRHRGPLTDIDRHDQAPLRRQVADPAAGA